MLYLDSDRKSAELEIEVVSLGGARWDSLPIEKILLAEYLEQCLGLGLNSQNDGPLSCDLTSELSDPRSEFGLNELLGCS